ncbi:MAG: twin-arginine translocase TatA/TatE family subunit [Gammaproteobacteria bacterium]
MGLGGISMWQLLIILLIVVMIFGTKHLKSIGSDLGGAVKGFRKAMSDADKEPDDPPQIGEPDAEFSESGAKDSGKQKSKRSGGA